MQMNIALSLNRAFIKPTTVVMYSVLKNSNRDNTFCFYLLSYDLSDGDISEIHSRLVEFKDRYTIINGKLSQELYDSLPKHSFWCKETYFRIVFSKMFPDVDKVLYLDSDVLVLSDLSELYSTDITDKAYAAVSIKWQLVMKNNPFIQPGIWSPFYTYDAFGFDFMGESVDYVNSGVMLINNQYWIDHNWVDRAYEFFDQVHKYDMPDQDCINILALEDGKDCRVNLNGKWNVFHDAFERDVDSKSVYYKNVFWCSDMKSEQLQNDFMPAIIHYSHCALGRPWQGGKGIYCDIYLQYAKKVGWDIKKGKMPFKRNIKKLILWWMPNGMLKRKQKKDGLADMHRRGTEIW